jgi:hypothetical protein
MELQKHYTTPEQSEQLLALGLPADSADMYYSQTHRRVVTVDEECDKRELFKAITPRWSTGRIIEIFNIVTPKQERFMFWMSITKYKILNYTGVFVEALQELKDHDALDFSKLND